MPDVAATSGQRVTRFVAAFIKQAQLHLFRMGLYLYYWVEY
ncbi:hypothetical protein BN128_2952 [Cronobacter sakazakii 696]|nr:hypothetical protein BN128_2952 [Cronobacter sakazakii 696]